MMDIMESATSLVSALGFPIVACVIMWRFISGTMEEMRRTLEEIQRALAQSAQAMALVAEQLEDMEKRLANLEHPKGAPSA